jgi:prepilin-type N-terminal cleavage/methylation domain-containing protein
LDQPERREGVLHVSRSRQQSGFTVVELLVAMAVLGVVAVGAMTLIEVVMRQGRGVIDRTESAQRGRLVLDQMTRQIRSQVCPTATTKGLVGATPNALTFYTDLSDGSTAAAPVKRKLEYDAPSKSIVQYSYKPDGTTVDSRRVLLQNVAPATDPEEPAKPARLFSYYAYLDDATGGLQSLADTPVAADVPRIAVVKVNLGVHPHATSDSKAMTALNDRVVLRNADPNATNNDPTCQ